MDAKQATALRKPFPPESVGQLPKGGVMLDYVGHAAVTDRLLTVDPDWSWEPLALGPDGLPAFDKAHNLWIRLTVCGVTRLGVGDGKNPKECIGDAIRNAAMRFGVALDLWAKENLVEFAQAANAPSVITTGTDYEVRQHGTGLAEDLDRVLVAPPLDDPPAEHNQPMTEKTRGTMFALFGDLNIPDADQLPGINHVLGTDYASRGRLTEAEAKRVVAVLRKRKREAAS